MYVDDIVLFDQIDFRVGAQRVQVMVGEDSGVAVDDAELMGDVAIGGREAAPHGADMGGERNPPLVRGVFLSDATPTDLGPRILARVMSQVMSPRAVNNTVPAVMLVPP